MSSAYVVPAGYSKDNLAVLTAAAPMLVLHLAALAETRPEWSLRERRETGGHRKPEPYRNTLRTAVEVAIERADAETHVVG